MQDQSGPSNSRTTIFALSGFIIGAVAWSGHLYTLLLLLLLPVLLPLATTRVHFVALMAAYHAGATWTLVPGSHVFFGSAFRPVDSLLLWFAAIIVLTLPYTVSRMFAPSQLYWTLPVALIIAAFLPTAIESPLTIAGALFPRLGWIGLIITLALYGTITRWPVLSLSFAAFLFAFCHLNASGNPQAPQSWAGVDTRFGGTGFVASNTLSSYEDALKIQAFALDTRAAVTVFPETVVKNWNSATDLFWRPTFDELASSGRTIIVGAEQSGTKLGAYSNVLMIRGAQTAVFRQRVPIPIAMWHPFDDLGVPLNISGPSTITINATRVAPIICYEQLLAFPVLDAMRSHPALILGVANDYWARDTTIPQLQSSSLSAWSRLFWIPVVSAVNQ